MKKPMFASTLKFNEAPTFIDELVKRQDEIMTVLRPVRGFHSYYVIKTSDGVTAVTVCDDRAGVDESNRLVAGWLKDKLPTFATKAPEVSTGEVRVHLTINQPEPVKV